MVGQRVKLAETSKVNDPEKELTEKIKNCA